MNGRSNLKIKATKPRHSKDLVRSLVKRGDSYGTYEKRTTGFDLSIKNS
jgi:hypothetical protein